MQERRLQKSILKKEPVWWRPLKVRVLIIQRIGWFEFGILLDLGQPIFLSIEHDYTSGYIRKSVIQVHHNLSTFLRGTFLA